MNILGSTLSNISCHISDIFCQISLISFEQLVNRPNSPPQTSPKKDVQKEFDKTSHCCVKHGKASCIFNQAEMTHNRLQKHIYLIMNHESSYLLIIFNIGSLLALTYSASRPPHVWRPSPLTPRP